MRRTVGERRKMAVNPLTGALQISQSGGRRVAATAADLARTGVQHAGPIPPSGDHCLRPCQTKP